MSLGGVIFPVLYLFLPPMLVAESINKGIVKIIGVFSLCCAIVGLVVSPVFGALIFSVFGPMILIFHYMILKKSSINLTIFVCAGVFFLSVIVSLYSFGVTAQSLNSSESIKVFIEAQKNVLELSDIDISRSELTIMYNRMLQLLPGTLVIISLVISYVTYVITGRTLLKKGAYILQPSSFIFFRIPKGVFEAMLIVGVLIYGVQALTDYRLNILIDNVLMVFEALFTFVGVAVFLFFLNRAMRGKMLKLIILLFMFMVPGASTVFLFAGILDSLFNFRKLP
ncbi:MAG: DUF2232 domain-containing protein [Peptoniphilus sp.]|nr:DUF2232 domain-containing protein [Peptoniphilus sp.]